jgi:hypothetical protein
MAGTVWGGGGWSRFQRQPKITLHPIYSRKQSLDTFDKIYTSFLPFTLHGLRIYNNKKARTLPLSSIFLRSTWKSEHRQYTIIKTTKTIFKSLSIGKLHSFNLDDLSYTLLPHFYDDFYLCQLHSDSCFPCSFQDNLI